MKIFGRSVKMKKPQHSSTQQPMVWILCPTFICSYVLHSTYYCFASTNEPHFCFLGSPFLLLVDRGECSFVSKVVCQSDLGQAAMTVK